MGHHHVAFAEKDLDATRCSYTESVGSTLVESSLTLNDGECLLHAATSKV